jgi:hypothetical protein
MGRCQVSGGCLHLRTPGEANRNHGFVQQEIHGEDGSVKCKYDIVLMVINGD